MSTRLAAPWRAATYAVGARIALACLMLAMQASSGEGSQSFLLDMPTIGVYYLLGAAGVHMHVVDTHDLRFLAIAIAVWAVAGFWLGMMIRRWWSSAADPQ